MSPLCMNALCITTTGSNCRLDRDKATSLGYVNRIEEMEHDQKLWESNCYCLKESKQYQAISTSYDIEGFE
jgi:hypothetical protein